MSAHIAIVEDDPQIASRIATLVQREGMSASTAISGAELDDLLKAHKVDLIILDLNLGKENGIEIARQLRARSNVSIIMVTGRREMESRIAGLDAGADDYVTKPFTGEELLARVRSVLRRSQMQSGGLAEEAAGKVTLDDLHFDAVERKITGPGGGIEILTYFEALVLGRMLRTPNEPVSRQELMRFAAGREWRPEDRSLDVHISHLRRKLDDAGVGKVAIRSARGRGYMIAAAGRAV